MSAEIDCAREFSGVLIRDEYALHVSGDLTFSNTETVCADAAPYTFIFSQSSMLMFPTIAPASCPNKKSITDCKILVSAWGTQSTGTGSRAKLGDANSIAAKAITATFFMIIPFGGLNDAFVCGVCVKDPQAVGLTLTLRTAPFSPKFGVLVLEDKASFGCSK